MRFSIWRVSGWEDLIVACPVTVVDKNHSRRTDQPCPDQDCCRSLYNSLRCAISSPMILLYTGYGSRSVHIAEATCISWIPWTHKQQSACPECLRHLRLTELQLIAPTMTVNMNELVSPFDLSGFRVFSLKRST
jgi:hypothetical protein